MTIHKVAIITGASQGIGAGPVAGYRGRDWAVVASARRIKPSEEPDLLAAGVLISKPFTGYTAADYARITGVNLAGFFRRRGMKGRCPVHQEYMAGRRGWRPRYATIKWPSFVSGSAR